MNRRLVSMDARVVLCLVALVAGAQAVRSETLYYGLLHAHTSFSDGMGTPAEAFEMASHDVDFFAVTPHNHAAAEGNAKERADGVLIATDHDLYESDQPLTIHPNNGPGIPVVSVQRAAAEATDPNFVAIYGQEFSTISAGNHMNVFALPHVIEVKSGDFKGFFDMLDEYVQDGHLPPVVQLNHPDVHEDLFYGGSNTKTKKKMFNDYGLDDYGRSFSSLVEAADPFVVLIEVLSGPAMKKSPMPNWHYSSNESDYYYYLVQGFHISPSVGHDNHYKTWGHCTPARMGVYASSLTQDALFDAMRANRTFATEDSDLRLEFSINGHPMGSCLALDAGSELAIGVDVADADEPNAEYDVTLEYGGVAPQDMQSLKEWHASDGVNETVTVQGNGSVSFDGYLASGEPEFYYVRVRQDGDDRAWSAPIWINHPRPETPGEPLWVWTKNRSRYYHHPWCRAVLTIHEENRRSGIMPPAGRELHNCKPPASDVSGH